MSKRYFQSVKLAVFTAFFFLMIYSCKTSDDQIIKTVTAVADAVAPNVTVKVQNGVVTLNGIIPDSVTKSDLDTAIRKMRGVVSLKDNTTVPPLAAEIISVDKTIAHTIDSALQANNISGVTVSVYNEIVNLQGNITKKDFTTLQRIVDSAHPKKVLNGLVVK